MNYEISTKVYKLDFQELINNATNKEYWTRKWEIYNYDGMSIEFTLDSINIAQNKLLACVKLVGVENGWSIPSDYMTIPLQKENFMKLALEKELVGKVDSLFLTQGEKDLKKTDKYMELEELEDELNDKLKEIAEEFLDDNNVYNKSIREVYIDNYVDKNQKDYTSDYIRENKYNQYVPHRATFAYIMGCDDKADWIIKVSNVVDCEWIFEEAEELRAKLEDGDLEEFEDELEDL